MENITKKLNNITISQTDKKKVTFSSNTKSGSPTSKTQVVSFNNYNDLIYKIHRNSAPISVNRGKCESSKYSNCCNRK